MSGSSWVGSRHLLCRSGPAAPGPHHETERTSHDASDARGRRLLRRPGRPDDVRRRGGGVLAGGRGGRPATAGPAVMGCGGGGVVLGGGGGGAGRHREPRPRSLELLDPRSMPGRSKAARRNHPNAFRQWTAEDEQTLIEMFHRGASKDELVET